MTDIKLRKGGYYKDAKENTYCFDEREAWTKSFFHPMAESKVACKVCKAQAPRLLREFYTENFFCTDHLPEGLEKWYYRFA